jgi:hypothetical protein
MAAFEVTTEEGAESPAIPELIDILATPRQRRFIS